MKRWNWIDILIVLVLVAAVAFAAVKVLGGNENTPAETAPTATMLEPNLRIVVSCEDVTRELAENIIAALERGSRDIDGTMVESTRLLSGSTLLDGSVVAWELREQDNGLCELRLTEEAYAKTSGTVTLVGIQEIRIGNTHFVKTVDVEIQGTIVSMTEISK